MKRRHLLKRTALLGTSGLVAIGSNGCWAWRTEAEAQPAGVTGSPRLIVILLRGAADGLNIVVPYQEAEYYQARPAIAIPKPGTPEGALDLDGQFGLHPALQPLMAEWKAGNLAFVHACGSPDPTRSHFEAQDYIENGTPGDTATPTGWLNRLLVQLPRSNSTQAISVSGKMPLIFSGSEPVASLAVNSMTRNRLPIDRPEVQAAFDQLYSSSDKLAQVYQEGRSAREVIVQEFAEEMMAASKSAPSPEQFAGNAQSLARLMVGDAATQVAFMELGNWDTHVNEKGIMQRNLTSLAAGLSELTQGLGDLYNNTTIVVMSEFGRTVAENGNGGTDHGHGNALWLLGGGLKGKQVYGEWPGLDPEELHDGRDLAITTDFRDVLISLLDQKFGLEGGAIAQIFPDYQVQKTFQLA